jgi:hypothetical protein
MHSIGKECESFICDYTKEFSEEIRVDFWINKRGSRESGWMHQGNVIFHLRDGQELETGSRVFNS